MKRSAAGAVQHSIIFTGQSLEGLSSGQKTQTRRILDPQPHPNHYLQPMWGRSPDSRGRRGNGSVFGERWLWREVGPDYPDGPEDDRRCPYGVPGSELWVRESWYVTPRYNHLPAGEVPRSARIFYVADGRDDAWAWAGRVRSPFHMPRWMSRYTIRLIDVRLEQLQAMSEADARAEGVPCEWQDVIEASERLRADLMERISSVGKIPYDDVGLAAVEEKVRQALAKEMPVPRVRAEVSPTSMADRAARVLPMQIIIEQPPRRARTRGTKLWRAGERWVKTAKEAYSVGWDELNGGRATWSSNPWVWALGFEVMRTRSAA